MTISAETLQLIQSGWQPDTDYSAMHSELGRLGIVAQVLYKDTAHEPIPDSPFRLRLREGRYILIQPGNWLQGKTGSADRAFWTLWEREPGLPYKPFPYTVEGLQQALQEAKS